MNPSGIRYERSRYGMRKSDDVDRWNAAARKGRLIDRIFRAKCARLGLNPEAARAAGPLLSLELAECLKKTNHGGSQADCEAS